METPEERQARKAKRDEALRQQEEEEKAASAKVAEKDSQAASAKEAEKDNQAASAKEAEKDGKAASAKEAEKDSKAASAKEAEKDSKAASAKEVEKDSKAASAKEVEKDNKAASAKEVTLTTKAETASEKEAGKDSKATFAKEVTLKSNAETASEKETGKGKKAATEKAMAPKATYKEVLQGWQEREKEAHEEQQWTVAPRRKRKKRHTRPEASKPGGYVALGTSSSSSPSPSPAKPKPPLEKRVKQLPVKKIAVDWHGVFEVKRNGRDVIPDSHIRALWDLEGDGWHTTLLSYAGWKREQQVRAKLNEMHVSFDEIIFVRERTGSSGKAAKALEKGITHIIDDNGDILWESLEKGLEILPVMSKWDERWWAPTSKGIASHYDFPAAVKALIAGETYVV